MKKFLTLLLVMSSLGYLSAQDEGGADLYEMSLEDLMEIDIYSVSKKAESLFDAPLSSSTITRAEIENSGAVSIPEALRLVPGLIVREISNGVYDVHLRGFDNLLRFNDGTDASNQITLVMIDGRPVFNNNLGGVYWEAVPVDLIDVERIEVVRGPSAPLYGPNAVEGVINIITTRVLEDGANVRANLSTGSDNTQIAGLSLGYKFNDKLSATISGNLQRRDRQETGYFEYLSGTIRDNAESLVSADRFGQLDTLGALAGEKLPDQEVALDKKGINLFLDYKVTEDFNINIQAGAQESQVQKIYQENAFTPYSTSFSDSKYASINATKGNLRGRLSYINGFDNLTTFTATALLQYDYETIDAFIEYDWHINDKLSLRPGINYQRATYTDEPYINPSEFVIGVLNNERTIRTFATSLSADYRITDKWRAIGGVRFDRFSQPDDVYVSYQLANTYKINDKNLIRAVIAKSNSGSFIGPNFLDVDLSFPTPFGEGQLLFQGNDDLELFSVRTIELGYRTKVFNNLELNFELFRQVGENASALIGEAPPTPNPLSLAASFKQLDLKAIQNGITFSANYVPYSSLQIKPFLTWQSTTTENAPTGLSTPAIDAENNITNLEDIDNDQTPTIFGGAYINYQPTKKLNINLNPYYTSAQTQYSFYSLSNPTTDIGDIDGKLIFNAKVSYDITNNVNLYVNGRNIFDNDSREYFGADRNGGLYLVGLNVKF